jgi:hypothetical protein
MFRSGEIIPFFASLILEHVDILPHGAITESGNNSLTKFFAMHNAKQVFCF